MKKAVLICGIFCMLALTSCNSTSGTESSEAQTNISAENSESETETKAEAEAETEAETEAGSQSSNDLYTDNLNQLNALTAIAEPQSYGTVTLGNYTGLEVKVPEVKAVDDADIDSYLKENVYPNYTEEVDSPSEMGDTVCMNFHGTINGEDFEGCDVKEYYVSLGSNAFIDGIDEKIQGHKKGDKFSETVTYAEDYDDEVLAGQTVDFDFEIMKVMRQRELDDKLASDITDGEITTAEAYRESIRKQLQDDRQKTSDDSVEQQLIDQIYSNSTVEPSDEAINYAVNNYVIGYNNQLQQKSKIDLAYVLSLKGQTLSDFMESAKYLCKSSLIKKMILQEVASKESLEITDSDYQDYADSIGVDVAIVKSMYNTEQVEKQILQDKAMDFIKENSTITYEK